MILGEQTVIFEEQSVSFEEQSICDFRGTVSLGEHFLRILFPENHWAQSLYAQTSFKT